MAVITRPELPPMAGYVEVEVDGVRKYKNVVTGYILGEEPEAEATTDEVLNALLGVTE